jgi:metallophosphoesterase superfamily enzyme
MHDHPAVSPTTGAGEAQRAACFLDILVIIALFLFEKVVGKVLAGGHWEGWG